MRAVPPAVVLAVLLAGTPVSAMVISEFYASGGKSGALYNRDFVILKNTTTGPVDLSGWSFQHYKTGDGWQVLPLTPTILAPGGAYLIRLFDDQGPGAGSPLSNVSLAAPDTSAWNLSTTNGEALALVRTTAVLASCASPTIVDLVGYNAGAPCREGGTIAPTTTDTQSSQRRAAGTQDTNDNAADFRLGTPRATLAGGPDGGGFFVDAGPTPPDAAAAGQDASVTLPDASVTPPDASVSPEDASQPLPDAAVPEDAAAEPGVDATVSLADGAVADATGPAVDATLVPTDAGASGVDAARPSADASHPGADGGRPLGPQALEMTVGCGCGAASAVGFTWAALAALGVALRRKRSATPPSE